METTHPPHLLGSLECESRTLHPGLPSLVEERLRTLDPASADPVNAAELLGLLASVLQNACTGNVAADYADGLQNAMQDCVRLAAAMVSWMAQGGVTALAASSPEACSNLKDFVAAALDLASHAFFSHEWYQQLGPARYVQAGNAVRAYVRDLAPAALDATEACWRAVEQQLACGDPTGEELLEACRALFGALFEGLQHLGTTSAERINNPAVPREMRSFAGLNILWTGLSRVMTTLPAEALQQLLSGCAVQSVLRALLGYLASEVRAMATSPPAEYETRLKVSRFWLQHAARVAQAHPAAAAACWDELAAATAEVYGRLAAAGSAAAAAEHQPSPPAPSQDQQHHQQQQAYAQLQAQVARDLDSAIAVKMTSLLAIVLDAGTAEDGAAQDGSVAAHHGGGPPPASPQQLQARLAKLEALAQAGSTTTCGAAAAAAAAAAGGAVAGATPGTPSGAATSPAGAVLLCLALLQRAAHVSPEARAVMVSRSLPWAGVTTAACLYSMALQQCGPLAVAPCLDLSHQLAASALALLAAAAEQQGQGGGRDADTFAAGCAIVCNWGTCAHPLLSNAAADVLSTLVQHCEPQLAVRLIAAVARLAGLAAAAEAAAAAFGCSAAVGGGGADRGGEAAAAFGGGAGGRLERLLVSMLVAASPEAEPAWREVLEELASMTSQVATHDGSGLNGSNDYNGCAAAGSGGGSQPGGAGAAPLDLCGAASARVLWGAAAGATAVQVAAAAARSGGLPPGGGGGGEAACGGVVSEQELGDRARRLVGSVRHVSAAFRFVSEAAAVLGSCSVSSGGGSGGAGGGFGASAWAPPPGSSPTPSPVALTRQWLAQLLGCLEVTVAHIRHVGASGLQPLVSEIAELAAEVLQALVPDLSTNGAASGSCGTSSSGGAGSGSGGLGSGADVAAAHAAACLVARTADCMSPAALASLAPALTWLAQCGTPPAAADVAATATYCNSPPPEALFHALLRYPHAAVMHAALQSQVHVCRTVPQQHAASVRRLFPPDFTLATAAGTAAAAQVAVPSGGPSVQLAAVFKSYMSRKVSDDDAAAAVAAAPQARAAEGERLASAAMEGCGVELATGRPAAPRALREAVNRGAQALQACASALASASASARSTEEGGCGPMVIDPADGALDSFGSGGAGSLHPPHQPFNPQQQQPQAQRQQYPHQQQQQQPGSAAAAGGPLTPLVADDNAALNVLRAALGGLERSLGALHATVVAQGINRSRPADWDQLQVHARALLGDLSSATSRIRNMNELLYALQGR
ncbi:hypothetical protein PLESTM_000152500 [Pleodorina starrii]|nr:hypothetical protein PLESTM_000152500 [Pleodorina starrii]